MSPRISLRLLSAQSDARLFELVSAGHERAFEAVVDRYRRPLLAYCARLGIPEARREDVLQQAFMRAWVAVGSGTEVRELRPWLYRIVHNTALNSLRGVPAAQGGAELAEDAGLVADTADIAEFRLEARRALSDVAALPPLQRNALLMSAIDGRSHEEMAAALGVSDGAVRGLLYRARTTLRAAAAAFTPGWALQWAARPTGPAPSAARIAEIAAAGGGGEAVPLLVKGVALATTAALAAGAALGPLDLHAHRSRHPAGSQQHNSLAAAGTAAAASGGLGLAPGSTRGASSPSARSVPGERGAHGSQASRHRRRSGRRGEDRSQGGSGLFSRSSGDGGRDGSEPIESVTQTSRASGDGSAQSSSGGGGDGSGVSGSDGTSGGGSGGGPGPSSGTSTTETVQPMLDSGGSDDPTTAASLTASPDRSGSGGSGSDDTAPAGTP